MIFHALCDIIYLKRLGAFSARAHFFLEYVIRKHWMIRQGLALEQPYQEALEAIDDEKTFMVE